MMASEGATTLFNQYVHKYKARLVKRAAEEEAEAAEAKRLCTAGPSSPVNPEPEITDLSLLDGDDNEEDRPDAYDEKEAEQLLNSESEEENCVNSPSYSPAPSVSSVSSFLSDNADSLRYNPLYREEVKQNSDTIMKKKAVKTEPDEYIEVDAPQPPVHKDRDTLELKALWQCQAQKGSISIETLQRQDIEKTETTKRADTILGKMLKGEKNLKKAEILEYKLYRGDYCQYQLRRLHKKELSNFVECLPRQEIQLLPQAGECLNCHHNQCGIVTRCLPRFSNGPRIPMLLTKGWDAHSNAYCVGLKHLITQPPAMAKYMANLSKVTGEQTGYRAQLGKPSLQEIEAAPLYGLLKRRRELLNKAVPCFLEFIPSENCKDLHTLHQVKCYISIAERAFKDYEGIVIILLPPPCPTAGLNIAAWEKKKVEFMESLDGILELGEARGMPIYPLHLYSYPLAQSVPGTLSTVEISVKNPQYGDRGIFYASGHVTMEWHLRLQTRFSKIFNFLRHYRFGH